MQIAAIDIGSNSIHMVIARAIGGGDFEVVDREREVVQVGRGSFRGARLRAEAVRRTVSALARFIELARRRQVDHILCAATAAVRESGNAGAFIAAARQATGISPSVIPPEEEGRLIYLAVQRALQLEPEPALIVDIGGCSLQLVVGNREKLLTVASAPLGALRLTETYLDGDPPSDQTLERLQNHIRKQAADALTAIAAHHPVRAYGASGTIHALAQLAHLDRGQGVLERVNGFVLEIDALRRLAGRLERMRLREREGLQGIDASRAEIIVPGARVLLHVLEELNLDGITISDFGLREGLVTDYLASHAREVSVSGEVEDLRVRSALQVLQKFQPEDWQVKHAWHVSALALAMFDGLATRHGLGARERDALQLAALLHDVGAAVAYDNHGEHSYYLIHNANLRGLAPDEVERVALVARYHSKGRPRRRDPRVEALTRRDRRVVRWLTALLRIAEALDRSHYQRVAELEVRRRRDGVVIRARTRPGAQLEIWAARQRVDLLARMLGCAVTVRPALTAARGARAGRNGVGMRRPAIVRAPRPAPRELPARAPEPRAAEPRERGGRSG